jgi:hypothetical protein
MSIRALLAGIAALSVLSASAAHADESFRIVWQCGNVTVSVTPKSTDYGPAMEYKVIGIEKSNNVFKNIKDDLYLNGKLCWPVEPVTCLKPDGTSELCSSRQVPLPKPRPAEAPAPIPIDKTVLYYEPGGLFKDHMERWKALALSGDGVEIRGTCISGCTLIMMHVPDDRLCFSDDASLQFHLAWDRVTGKANMALSKWMIDNYPQNIRTWLMDRGGIEKMSIAEFWTLNAEELWAMGYRKCGLESVVPMTIVQKAPEFWRKLELDYLDHLQARPPRRHDLQ